jgi:hypothetical protein
MLVEGERKADELCMMAEEKFIRWPPHQCLTRRSKLGDMTKKPNPIPTNSTPLEAFSRQRRGQLRMRELGRCLRCGAPAIGSLCAAHLVRERERQRRIRGFSRRNLKCRSYIFEATAKEAQSQTA